jgi:hypothetical protein
VTAAGGITIASDHCRVNSIPAAIEWKPMEGMEMGQATWGAPGSQIFALLAFVRIFVADLAAGGPKVLVVPGSNILY